MSEALRQLPSGWRLEPGLVAALVLCAGAYLAGAARARRWPMARTTAFLAGLAVLAVALLSGLHAAGEELLSAHMVQHLLITLVAPPLLLAGAPIVLALRTLPRGPRQALARLVVGRPGRVAAHPAVALAVFCAVMVGTHVPAFYDAALRAPVLHVAEHVLFVSAALLLWVPILGVEPLPHAPSPVTRLLTVMAAMPPMILVGVALTTASTVVYAPYAETSAAFGTTALADQAAAGRIMWLGGAIGMAAVALVAAWRAMLREERRAVLAERLREERSA